MKCMISFSSVVLLLLIDHQAMGASFSLQAQLIGAQGKLDPSKTENVGSTAGFARTGIEGVREEITAPGFGVNMAYKMTEAARVNGNLAWVNFDEGNTKPQYMDASAGVNASYDVYASNDFAIYGLGGVSYHWIDLSDLRLGDEKIKFDNLSLVNYDVGLGTRVELTPSVRFDIAYRYGDTLQKDNVKTKTTDRGTIIDGKFKDIALIKNELAASVGYQF